MSSISFSQNADFTSKTYKKLKDGKLILTGNVFIKTESFNIKADKVILDTKTNDYKAIGHAVLTRKNGDVIKGKSLFGNFKEKDFNGTNITIKDKTGYYTGETLRVTDFGEEKNIKMKSGTYTSCCNNPPDWEIWGSSIDATTENYAYIANAVFKIKKIPFFYFPYIIFPTKTKRQTGLLFPHMYSGSDGFGIALPIFVTLGKSHDFTITPGYIKHRGWNAKLEFRSVFSQKSWQLVNYFYIKDKKYLNTQRHYFNIKNFFKTSQNTYVLTDYSFLSDIYMARDFPFIVSNSYDPALENSFIFSYNLNNVLFGTNLSINQNLIEEDYIQRPLVKFFYNKTFGFLLSNFEFLAEGLAYNKQINNDLFINLKSNFSIPYSFYGLNLKPELEFDIASLYYKHTNNIGGDLSDTKTYMAYNFVFNINTVFFRNYGNIYHSIEPFIEYHLKNRQNTYLDSLNTYDFFDELFKVSSTNYIVYGLKSRLNSSSNLYFEAKDVYDLEQGKREYFLSQLYGTAWLFRFNTSVIIPDFRDIDSSRLNLGVRFGTFANYLGTSFSYIKDSLQQESFSAKASFWNIVLYSRLVYDYLDQKVKEKLYSAGIAPDSKCWTFKVEAKDTFEKEGTDYRFMFSLMFAGKTFGFERE